MALKFRALIQNRLRNDLLVGKTVEPIYFRASKNVRSRDSKDIASLTLSYDVGDPQTYALLHCSVFKERT